MISQEVFNILSISSGGKTQKKSFRFFRHIYEEREKQKSI